jgi:hypothetical protein
MNRLLKRLLAKYVKYIEIIGYTFVGLFVAGLLALSYIKAEDEWMTLNGQFTISSHIIRFAEPCYLLEMPADSITQVQTNTILARITFDPAFRTDKTLLRNLEQQITPARAVGDQLVVGQLQGIVNTLKKRNYPNLAVQTVTAPASGEFLTFFQENSVLPAQTTLGVVLDCAHGSVQVTDFSTNTQAKTRLKPGQTGTVTVKLNSIESLSLPIKVSEVTTKAALMHVDSISIDQKFKLAHYLAANTTSPEIHVNLSVLIGWRSWMKLIWR